MTTQKNLTSHPKIEQKTNETLRAYLKRFIEIRFQTKNCPFDMALVAPMNDIDHSRPKLLLL